MHWKEIEGNWARLKTAAMGNWAQLTNDDLSRIAGDQLQLIGRIQQRYAVARAEAERQVTEWALTVKPLREGASRNGVRPLSR